MKTKSIVKNLSDIAKLNENDLINDEGKLQTYDLALYCLERFNILTLQDSDEIYIYNNGVYVPNGKKIIASFVQSNELGLGGAVTIQKVNELLGYIKRLTYKKREEIQENDDLLCLENGILNLKTLQIFEHDHELIFFNKIPVAYNKDADCVKIKNFLREVVPEDSIEVIQELAGYCLLKSYPIHKAFMFVGAGANGKSTLINLIKAFLGQENCSSIPLQQLETNRFALAVLFGKLVNMFADLPSRALRETSCFKMLTGEDLIQGEKKFQDHFTFTNYAKMIFSANQIPRSPDDSDAFFRRWIIINFPNQFLKNADKKLLKKLISQGELSGFLNFAIEGLKRLLENGDFSNSKSIEAIREEYIRQSDSVSAFKMDLLELDPESYIIKKELYTAYADYCRNMKYIPVSDNYFHKQLAMIVRVEDFRPNIPIKDESGKDTKRNERPSCWRGIRIKVGENNTK